MAFKNISATWFSIGFCISYCLAFFLEAPAFYYYPLEGIFTFSTIPDSASPAMAWYGLLANAIIGATVCGLIGRDQWLRHSTLQALPIWLAVASILFCIYVLRHFWW